MPRRTGSGVAAAAAAASASPVRNASDPTLGAPPMRRHPTPPNTAAQRRGGGAPLPAARRQGSAPIPATRLGASGAPMPPARRSGSPPARVTASPLRHAPLHREAASPAVSRTVSSPPTPTMPPRTSSNDNIVVNNAAPPPVAARRGPPPLAARIGSPPARAPPRNVSSPPVPQPRRQAASTTLDDIAPPEDETSQPPPPSSDVDDAVVPVDAPAAPPVINHEHEEGASPPPPVEDESEDAAPPPPQPSDEEPAPVDEQPQPPVPVEEEPQPPAPVEQEPQPPAPVEEEPQPPTEEQPQPPAPVEEEQPQPPAPVDTHNEPAPPQHDEPADDAQPPPPAVTEPDEAAPPPPTQPDDDDSGAPPPTPPIAIPSRTLPRPTQTNSAPHLVGVPPPAAARATLPSASRSPPSVAPRGVAARLLPGGGMRRTSSSPAMPTPGAVKALKVQKMRLVGEIGKLNSKLRSTPDDQTTRKLLDQKVEELAKLDARISSMDGPAPALRPLSPRTKTVVSLTTKNNPSSAPVSPIVNLPGGRRIVTVCVEHLSTTKKLKIDPDCTVGDLIEKTLAQVKRMGVVVEEANTYEMALDRAANSAAMLTADGLGEHMLFYLRVKGDKQPQHAPLHRDARSPPPIQHRPTTQNSTPASADEPSGNKSDVATSSETATSPPARAASKQSKRCAQCGERAKVVIKFKGSDEKVPSCRQCADQYQQTGNFKRQTTSPAANNGAPPPVAARPAAGSTPPSMPPPRRAGTSPVPGPPPRRNAPPHVAQRGAHIPGPPPRRSATPVTMASTAAAPPPTAPRPTPHDNNADTEEAPPPPHIDSDDEPLQSQPPPPHVDSDDERSQSQPPPPHVDDDVLGDEPAPPPPVPEDVHEDDVAPPQEPDDDAVSPPSQPLAPPVPTYIGEDIVRPPSQQHATAAPARPPVPDYIGEDIVRPPSDMQVKPRSASPVVKPNIAPPSPVVKPGGAPPVVQRRPSSPIIKPGTAPPTPHDAPPVVKPRTAPAQPPSAKDSPLAYEFNDSDDDDAEVASFNNAAPPPPLDDEPGAEAPPPPLEAPSPANRSSSEPLLDSSGSTVIVEMTPEQRAARRKELLTSKMKLVGVLGKLKKTRPDAVTELQEIQSELDGVEEELGSLSDSQQTLIPLRKPIMARHDVLSGEDNKPGLQRRGSSVLLRGSSNSSVRRLPLDQIEKEEAAAAGTSPRRFSPRHGSPRTYSPRRASAGLAASADTPTKVMSQGVYYKSSTAAAFTELLNTEEKYVESLAIIEEHYRTPLLQQQIITMPEADALFGNVPLLHQQHTSFFHALDAIDLAAGDNDEALARSTAQELIALCLAVHDAVLAYGAAAPQRSAFVAQLKSSNEAFAHHCSVRQMAEACEGQDLDSFLIRPIQRVCRYPLLVKQMIKLTPVTELTTALNQLEAMAAALNEQK